MWREWITSGWLLMVEYLLAFNATAYKWDDELLSFVIVVGRS